MSMCENIKTMKQWGFSIISLFRFVADLDSINESTLTFFYDIVVNYSFGLFFYRTKLSLVSCLLVLQCYYYEGWVKFVYIVCLRTCLIKLCLWLYGFGLFNFQLESEELLDFNFVSWSQSSHEVGLEIRDSRPVVGSNLQSWPANVTSPAQVLLELVSPKFSWYVSKEKWKVPRPMDYRIREAANLLWSPRQIICELSSHVF